MTTYWAANNGGGSGLSSATPATLSTLWAGLVAGDTINLMDGLYQGANNMISPGLSIPGRSGTSANRITIQAVNDGAVRIDGQGLRGPLSLRQNNFWTFQGFNCSNGSGAVIAPYGSSQGCDNLIFRRIIAWNAGGSGPDNGTAFNTGNSHVFDISYSSNVLAEDCAAFGLGRNNFIAFQSTNVTFRRMWARFEGYDSNTGPHGCSQLIYRANGVKADNCIGIFSNERVHQCTNFGVDPMIFLANSDPQTLRSKISGCILYQKTSSVCNPGRGMYAYGDLPGPSLVDIRDVVVYTPIAGVAPYELLACASCTADRITGIRSTTSSFIHSSWNKTNFNESTSVASVPNIFNGASAANVCLRYQDGGLTSTPLWPWPMDDRIKAALAVAGSSALAGSSGPGFAAGTPTSEIVSIFGSIPAACLLAATPTLSISPASLSYSFFTGDPPETKTVTVSNTGAPQPMPWTVSDNQTWLSESPTSSADVGTFGATVDPAGLVAGSYGGTITVTAPAATSSPTLVPVTILITATTAVDTPTISVGGRGVMKIKRRIGWGHGG